MYTYKGVSYTEEEIKEAAKQSGITVQEYLDRLKEVDPKPEDKQEFSSEDLLDPTTFQADAAAGADVVSQPMQAPDTELVSEDISLEPLEIKDRKIPDSIRQEIIDIYKNRSKQLKLTEFGTFDYDDEKSIADFRDNSLSDFVNNNKTINEKIIPMAKKEVMGDFLNYEKEAKSKYNLDDPKNITQENIDSYVSDVSGYYNKILNSKIEANPEFKTLINDFNTVMDQQGEASLKRFVKGS